MGKLSLALVWSGLVWEGEGRTSRDGGRGGGHQKRLEHATLVVQTQRLGWSSLSLGSCSTAVHMPRPAPCCCNRSSGRRRAAALFEKYGFIGLSAPHCQGSRGRTYTVHSKAQLPWTVGNPKDPRVPPSRGSSLTADSQAWHYVYCTIFEP